MAAERTKITELATAAGMVLGESATDLELLAALEPTSPALVEPDPSRRLLPGEMRRRGDHDARLVQQAEVVG